MIHACLRLALPALLLATTALADWVPLGSNLAQPAPPDIRVLQDDAGGITVRVELSGFGVRNISTAGRTYHTIDLLTESATNEPGSPELPYVAGTFAIPNNVAVRVEVLETGEARTFPGFIPPPARPSWWEGEAEPPYVENKSVYASSEIYPRVLAELGEPSVFRDLRIVRLAVYPVQAVLSEGEVQVFSSITVRITYGPGEIINPKITPDRPIPPSFGALYRSSVVNYQNVLDSKFGGLETGREVLLCITPDTFATTFKTYATWRHKTGTNVVVKKFSEIGANATNPDLIKNYIAQAYTTWEHPPTYILLVGDYGKVPRKQVVYDYTFANEDYFVEIEGNDFFPEMMIGRFTHETLNGLQILINKFIKYERTPYTANQDWFKKAAVCSNDHYESQIAVKRFTAETMLRSGGFISVDTMMSSTPCNYSLTDVINAINGGRSYLNYRGEGWSSGWWASCYPFNTSNVSSINNGQMLTFVTSIGCGVAMFDVGSGNAFGEEWLELGSTSSPRGAVAFVGPTSNTHTTYNNKIDKGIYVGMFDEGMDTPGQALLRGKLYMFNIYGNEHWVEYHYRVYCILGDPSIHIWKDIPRRVDVTYPQVISVGYNQLEIVVLDSASRGPVAGAQVCLAGVSEYVVGVTDANGRTFVEVTPGVNDTLLLLVRGGRVIPVEGSIIAMPSEVHVAPLGVPVTVDLDGNLDGRINPNEHGRITFTLKNWGTQVAANVRATLASGDTNYAQVTTVEPAVFGNIAPTASAAGSPFEFYVKPACPVGSSVPLTLNIFTDTRSWNYQVHVQVAGCSLELTATQIDDQGSLNPNARLDPGEMALLSLTLANTGQDIAPDVVATLRTTDPYITIPDSIGSFGTVHIGETGTNAMNYFVVAVSPACSLNYTASFSVQLSTTNGNYPYNVTRSFSLPVGTPVGTDPTGPDSYGYYAYSSDDSTYSEAPRFDWVELADIGTEIPRNTSGDFTATATLPFTFRYYGVNYTQVRVSSDGWIAFGSGTQTSYSNYPLPRNDNVNCMVAPFWDDLFASGTAETGKLLYYSDPSNHRFIAEWNGVGHWGNAESREKFQVILLDPAFHPTPTGDGEILIQYHTVMETSSNTVGIEDNTQTIGLQYLYNDAYQATATALKNEFAIKFTTKPPSVLPSAVNIGVEIQPGWNLISNPVWRPDSNNTVVGLFPHSALEYAFAFNPQTGYSQSQVMSNGAGYWGKFPQSATNTIGGIAILRDTIPVYAGWNIIGSVSVFVDTASIVTIPPGIRSSQIYGFSGGYTPVQYLVPGHAYWCKVSVSGQMFLGHNSTTSPVEPEQGLLAAMNVLTIIDGNGSSQNLYFGAEKSGRIDWSYFALPPVPPEGAFDARFESPEGGLMARVHSDTSGGEMPIKVQAPVFPLKVKWNVYGNTYSLSSTGDAARSLTGEGEMTLTGPIDRLVLRLVASDPIPEEYALWQNYPNPFNPTTSIRFALPVQSMVRAEVFNILGQLVSTIVQEERKAGYHTIQWNGTDAGGKGVGSGVYFLRLNADGANGASFSSVRKLVLVK